MRPFVRDLLVFAALQGLVFALVWRACPRSDDHYASASIDKRERLATAARPRIIFVGGSSAAFGFDSRVFLDGPLAPVNLGHNRSLGLRFMLSQAGAALERGDVVVVSPEYELWWSAGVDEALINHLEHDPVVIRHLDWGTSRRLCDRGLSYVAGKIRCALHQVTTEPLVTFSRASFDERGDFVAHRGRAARPNEGPTSGWPAPHAIDLDESIAALQRFAARCEQVGARCVLAYAPLRRRRYEAHRATLERLQAEVQSRVPLPIVLPLHDAVHPAEDFFDMGPHLTEGAARARTERLRAGLESLPSGFEAFRAPRSDDPGR